MLELGFKHFVGVDGSQGMLDQAAKTGIYEELRLALLGAEPLPAKIGTPHTHTAYTLTVPVYMCW